MTKPTIHSPPQGFRPLGRGDYPAAKMITLEQELTHLIAYHANLSTQATSKPIHAMLANQLKRTEDRIEEMLGLQGPKE